MDKQPEQMDFTTARWTYFQRKRCIDEALIRDSVANDNRGVKGDKMKAVLRQINEFQGDNDVAWPSINRMAAAIGCHKRTVIRAIQGLQNLSLLIVQQHRLPTGQDRNVYRIVWNELEVLQPQQRQQWRDLMADQARESVPHCEQSFADPGDTVSPGYADPGDTVSNPGDTVSNPGDTVSNPGDTVSPELLTNCSGTVHNSPPLAQVQAASTPTRQQRPRCRGQRADEPVPVGWQVVVSVLELVGLSDTRGAITAAQRRELVPGDVQKLVDRWQRLKRAHHATDSQVPPGQRTTVGWLYRWITGASAPVTDAELDAIESAAHRAAKERESRSAKARQDAIDTIKHQTVIGCRRQGITDQAAIQTKMTGALQAAGFNDPKDWEW